MSKQETEKKREIEMEINEVETGEKYLRKFSVKFSRDVKVTDQGDLVLHAEAGIPKTGSDYPADKKFWIERVEIRPLSERHCEVVCFYAEKPRKKKKRKYSFPTVSRCPRCGATDTIATSTQGKVQYRRCLRAVCRHTYHVIGPKS